MKIVVRVPREDQTLVEILRSRGINAKLVKKGIIVELSKDSENCLLIPSELPQDAVFMIDAAEEGGAMTNTGSGTIVCGSSGKALKPYFVPKGYCNGEHAYFAVPEKVCTITGFRRDNNIIIHEHSIIKQDGNARIEVKELWSGRLDGLPETFMRFEQAAKAANQKGNCYHCRGIHYAALNT